ncbi:MAG: M56 family metallopeptidase [Bacteroidales bacterium]|nr:M56 family metallopeptidase [Bacteroidales bacterium]
MLSEHLIHALGWTLVHSFWQIALVALILKGAWWFLRKGPPGVRVILGYAALAMILAGTLVTFHTVYKTTAAMETVIAGPSWILPGEAGVLNAGYPAQEPVESLFQRGGWFVQQYLDELVICWLAGMLLFMIRLTGGMVWVARIRSQGRRQLGQVWQERIVRLQNKMGVRKTVRMYGSLRVKVPLVAGHLRPVILVPLGMVAGLPVDQMEAILLHELAHIRRHDYLLNVIKSILEAVFFYHPAFWWISRITDEAREHCCDDMALACCSDKDSLPKALLAIEESLSGSPVIAAAVSGRSNKLLNRIRRMRTNSGLRQGMPKTWAVPLLLMAGVFTVILHSAFAPRPAEQVGPSSAAIPGEIRFTHTVLQPVPAEKPELPATVIEEPQGNEALESVFPPDTLKDRSRGTVQIQLDREGNLVSVTIDGQPASEEEFNRYQKLLGKHAEVEQIEKAREALERSREQIETARGQYHKAMEAYREALRRSDSSLYRLQWIIPGFPHYLPDEGLLLLHDTLAAGMFPDGHMLWIPEPEEPRLRELYVIPERDRDTRIDILRDRDIDRIEDLAGIEAIREPELLFHNGELSHIKVFETVARVQLVQDHIIRNGQDLYLELSRDKMKVNGKKQPEEVRDKYLRLYVSITGKKIKRNQEIVIED